MDDLTTLLFVLGVVIFLIAIVTVVGHVIWLMAAWSLRVMRGTESQSPEPDSSNSRCLNCNFVLTPRAEFCPVCGSPKPSGITIELLKDLAASERQVGRFHRSGKLDERSYSDLKAQIDAERLRLSPRARSAPTSAPQPRPVPSGSSTQPVPSATEEISFTAETPTTPFPTAPPSIVSATFVATDDEIVIEPVRSFSLPQQQPSGLQNTARVAHNERVRATPPPRAPRRSFTEVLNAFMEESNIRWGEIIGGLLIIGCSTALTVSLWAQISRIPVLKFLIFTTVTAVLFGVGLYTEHRWKLPTTSRGILTIATLLVPLNFLAIAAVSSSTIPSGALVIGSELVAPAIFLCLVYFAGRVITPGCAHLLSAGVLGSSVGQLLVRHFAATDIPPTLLIFLGAFPVACYVLTVGLALRVVLADREIDESEITTVFTMLGTMTFAALLPFGLLLYKSGPLGLTMMYLAPLVTLGGLPLLATGTVLWRRIHNRELVASRTAGTALGILGTAIVLTGMFLAWPNPASVVPAALLNFAVFTLLAITLDLPVGHLFAAGCFGVAYLVLYHVLAGHISWQNLRVTSLLDQTLSLSSGQALVGLFMLFLTASEWLARLKKRVEGFYYLLAACSIAVISLSLVTGFGLWPVPNVGRPDGIWIVYALYALSAFWIAWSRKLVQFSWIGSGLLLCSFAQSFAQSLGFSFPWQTALLTHATVCAIAAILSSRLERRSVLGQGPQAGRPLGVLAAPLNYSALVSSFLAIVALVQADAFEITAMQAERVFWISAIWLVLLWLNRRWSLFTAFQIALVCAVVLSVKAMLQQYEWYAYQPHAFLHPWGLQIQGTALVLLSLAWIAVRLGVGRAQRSSAQMNVEGHDAASDVSHDDWLAAAGKLLNGSGFAVDRVLSWAILGAFVLLAVYGALSGVTQELASLGSHDPGWNIAGFPHQEALGIGSWILLGLLAITMIANLWERRSAVYLLGALVALSTIVPLIAGRFEDQIATASAWRWLAALLLIVTSLALWNREKILRQLETSGWPQLDTDSEELASRIRALLLAITCVPLVLLTLYPALRAIYYLPVQGPARGIFSFLNDDFSYSIPLVLVALVLIGYAIRERILDYAFVAGLFLNATVTIVYLLSVVAVGGSMNRVVFARAIQLNAISFGLYALLWLSARGRWETALGKAQAIAAERFFNVQVGIAIGLNAVIIVPVVIRLVLSPVRAGIGTFEAGSYLGWLAFFTALLPVAWLAIARKQRFSANVLAATLLAVSCLLAFSLSHVNVTMLTGLHTLTIAATLTAWLMLLASLLPSLDVDQIASSNSPLRWWRSAFELGGSWQAEAKGCAALIGALAAFSLCGRNSTIHRATGGQSFRYWQSVLLRPR